MKGGLLILSVAPCLACDDAAHAAHYYYRGAKLCLMGGPARNECLGQYCMLPKATEQGLVVRGHPAHISAAGCNTEINKGRQQDVVII